MYIFAVSLGTFVELGGLSVVATTIIGFLLTSMILFTKAKFVSTEDVKLTINDNDDLTIVTPAGGTILETLMNNGIAIPSPCGGKATCKQCKVQVVGGGSDALDVDKSTFNRKELEAGWRLSCQSKVKNDMKLDVEEHLLGVKEWEGTVVSNENVATFIKELIVKAPEEIPYRSGGYLQIHVPGFETNTSDWKGTMDECYLDDWEHFHMFDTNIDFKSVPPNTIRAYSMASYPAEERDLKFNIRIATSPFEGDTPSKKVPWGVCSSYTFSLKEGDKIKISGPYGESFMIDDERELIFLIGGAGSSFGRSHIMHLFRTEQTKRKVSMWYGARSIKENIYQDEYEELAKKHDNFSYHLALSEPLPEDIEAGWPKDDPIKTNFLFRSFELGKLKKMDEPEECLFYVCGPPLHNSSILKLLDDYGVPRENIILDDFGS